MNIFRKLLSIIIVSACATNAYAAVKIHGKVTEDNNEPLEFVTVRIAGTAIGATSGLDGTYVLSAPE